MHLGVVRSLSVLLPRCSEGGAGAGPEPVRLLALLLAGCSIEVRRWMLAVPAIKAWVDGPLAAEAETVGAASLEAGHRALWQLLASQLQTQQQQQRDGQLLQLLQCTDTASLPQLHRTLQLMLEVQAVSDGRVGWGATVHAQLKELGLELRTLATEQPQATGQQEAGDAAESLQAALLGGGAEDDLYDPADLKSPVDTGALKARRARQLAPECQRILKRLLVENSKAD
jgi:hypothetical protein